MSPVLLMRFTSTQEVVLQEVRDGGLCGQNPGPGSVPLQDHGSFHGTLSVTPVVGGPLRVLEEGVATFGLESSRDTGRPPPLLGQFSGRPRPPEPQRPWKRERWVWAAEMQAAWG